MNKVSVDDQRVRRVLSRVLRAAWQVQRTNPAVVRRTRPLSARRVASVTVGLLCGMRGWRRFSHRRRRWHRISE